MTPEPLFAQTMLGDTALLVIRLAASVGAAFIGWFLCDPLTRAIYRLSVGKPTPSWLVPWCKMAGAVLCGLLVFFFVPLGFGPGGLGFGPGAGGTPGAGKDKGGTGEQAKDSTPKADDRSAKADDRKGGDRKSGPIVREPVEIEVIGGKRYRNDERWYLIKREPPARTLKEVENFFKSQSEKLELHVILTGESPLPDEMNRGPIENLEDLAKKYQIPQLEEMKKTSAPPKGKS